MPKHRSALRYLITTTALVGLLGATTLALSPEAHATPVNTIGTGTTNIAYTGAIADYTVTTAGTYEIEAIGGGGGGGSIGGGGGATIIGDFSLSANQTLQILVGGGGYGGYNGFTGSGGGGGSYVVDYSGGLPLVVAGGGGGGGVVGGGDGGSGSGGSGSGGGGGRGGVFGGGGGGGFYGGGFGGLGGSGFGGGGFGGRPGDFGLGGSGGFGGGGGGGANGGGGYGGGSFLAASATNIMLTAGTAGQFIGNGADGSVTC